MRRWIFVGGTGRSGTTITARALSRSGDFSLVPTELRFHVDPGGLLDLAAGETTFEKFRKKLSGPWFERQTPGGMRGIGQHIDRGGVEAVLDGPLPHDEGPRRVAAEIWTRLLTAMFGPGRIIEMSPPTMMRADELSRMLDHRVVMVNVVRDGRDVAFSLTRMHWGPEDPISGLYWWAHRIRLADKARRLCPAPVLTVSLEGLSSQSRRESWAQELARHLGGVSVEDMVAAMGVFHPGRVDKGARWREDISGDVEEKVDRTYQELWLELRRDGVIGLPADPTG